MKSFAEGVGAVVTGASEGQLEPTAQNFGPPAFPRMRKFKRACLMEGIKARSHVPGFKELAESLADGASKHRNDHAGKHCSLN